MRFVGTHEEYNKIKDIKIYRYGTDKVRETV